MIKGWDEFIGDPKLFIGTEYYNDVIKSKRISVKRKFIDYEGKFG